MAYGHLSHNGNLYHGYINTPWMDWWPSPIFCANALLTMADMNNKDHPNKNAIEPTRIGISAAEMAVHQDISGPNQQEIKNGDLTHHFGVFCGAIGMFGDFTIPSTSILRLENRICKVLLSRVNWGVKPGKMKKQRQNTGETKKKYETTMMYAILCTDRGEESMADRS